MSESKIGKLFINRKNQFNPFTVNESRYYVVVSEVQPSLNPEEQCDYIKFYKGTMREDLFEDTFVEVDITKVSGKLIKELYLDIQLDMSSYSVRDQGGVLASVVRQRHLRGIIFSQDYLKVLNPFLSIKNKVFTDKQYKDLCKGIIS